MGGGVKINIPDYRTFKVDEVPALMKCQEKLAAKGLKDPWARNYVWKYRNPLTNHSRLPWYKYFTMPGTMRGFMLGLSVVGVYIVGDQIYGASTGRTDSHH